uniref:Uncharacterized protein n=1 Tax=Oryza meridionalis TaxID=40149 RepID=A0A0E0E1H6_9ORYZ
MSYGVEEGRGPRSDGSHRCRDLGADARDLSGAVATAGEEGAPEDDQAALATAVEPVVVVAVAIGGFGHNSVGNSLQHDKSVLITEEVKLRQEQQTTRTQMQAMEERISAVEQKQQQMPVFLMRAMKNLGVLHMLIDRQNQHGENRELGDTLSMKCLRVPPRCNGPMMTPSRPMITLNLPNFGVNSVIQPKFT